MEERYGKKFSQAEINAIFLKITKDIETPARPYEHLSVNDLVKMKESIQRGLMDLESDIRSPKTDEGKRLYAQLQEIYGEVRIRRHES